jgi:hypothetical protein
LHQKPISNTFQANQMNAEEIADFVGWLSSHRQGPAPGQSIPPGSDCCQHANLTLEQQ